MTTEKITLVKPDYSARSRAYKRIEKLQEENAATVKKVEGEIAKIKEKLELAEQKHAKAQAEIDSEKMTKYRQEISALKDTLETLETIKKDSLALKLPADELRKMAEEIRDEGHEAATKLSHELRGEMTRAGAKQDELNQTIRTYNEALNYLNSLSDNQLGTRIMLQGSMYPNVERLAAEITQKDKLQALGYGTDK